MQSILKYLMALTAVLLVSCGGGGGSPGAVPGAEDSVAVDSFDYFVDKNAITNSGTDASTLTLTALDKNKNPVKGAKVLVSVSSGIYTPVTTVTDDAGIATGKISGGSNKANRLINYSVTVDGKTRSDTIAVTGSKIVLTAVPAAPVPGGSVSLSVKVTDVNGSGIPSIPVNLSGSLGFTGSVTTDATGNANANIAAAPGAAGIYFVEASASGVSVKQDVQVISLAGGVPDAVGTISAASLAVVPNTIPPNASGSTASRAGLRALFQDSSNRAIKNVRVRFEIMPPGLGAGEFITTGAATVYTDANGVALADYVAGTRTSPTDGVVIRACYALTDAELGNNACPNFRTATMTVASEPLSITLGVDNKISKGTTGITYIKQIDIAVADAAGNAVSNAQISASVDLRRYGKGRFGDPANTWCLNEDANRNGFLDTGEDVNGNGDLDPRKADVIVSYVGGRLTGANGRTTIQVEYPQSVATWIEYAVKVTTSVAGSEGKVERFFITTAAEEDVANGSFLTSPYGTGSCTQPN